VAEKVRQGEQLKKRLAARSDAQRRKQQAALEAALAAKERQVPARVRARVLMAPAAWWRMLPDGACCLGAPVAWWRLLRDGASCLVRRSRARVGWRTRCVPTGLPVELAPPWAAAALGQPRLRR
jgi:hypothetical protein